MAQIVTEHIVHSKGVTLYSVFKNVEVEILSFFSVNPGDRFLFSSNNKKNHKRRTEEYHYTVNVTL